MSAMRYVTIWCDGDPDSPLMSCGDQVHGDDAASARRSAKWMGWKTAQAGGRDYCPEHAAELTP